MAARTGMQAIVDRVQTLLQEIDDPTLTDDEVQDVLDAPENHVFLAQHVLYPMNSTSDGMHNWYRAGLLWWESGDNAPAIKLAADDSTLAPDTSDYARGMWKFDTARSSSDVLYLSEGYSYDVYRAAAECCYVLIGKIRSGYTFSGPAGSFNRNERIATLRQMAERYSMSAGTHAHSSGYGFTPWQ
jgi:hypothetical protein